jgi:hypothetical protein
VFRCPNFEKTHRFFCSEALSPVDKIKKNGFLIEREEEKKTDGD